MQFYCIGTPDICNISCYHHLPDDSQLHVGASSLQFTSLIFYKVRVRDSNMAHYKISKQDVQDLQEKYMWCRCCLTICFSGFLSPRRNNFLQLFSCGPWRVFSHSNSPSHRALGRYRHMYSSRQFHNILCWLESSYLFLRWWKLSFPSFVKLNCLLLHIRNCDGWLGEFGLCFLSYLYFCETRSRGCIILCS